MKALNRLSESSFHKLFLTFIMLCLFAGAFCMDDRFSMLTGFVKILKSSCKPFTNYFAVGGYAATFFNMGLTAAVCLLLFCIFGTTVNHVSVLACLLSVGFSSWGIHVLNMLPGIVGVILYGIAQKEKLSGLANVMIFASGMAPIISELAVRYPGDRNGVSVKGVLLAIAVGLVVGFFLPSGIAHAPTIHKGFNLYSAAIPVGLSAFLTYTLLFKIPGVPLPSGLGGLEVASWSVVNKFCFVVFGLCIVIAYLMGARFYRYYEMMAGFRPANGITAAYGNAMFLMNVGVYGLFILLYYNFVSASFNGVTMGLIFCMVACSCSGSHPGNVWPIMLGYITAGVVFQCWSVAVGVTLEQSLQAQSVLTGVCFANGLSPVSDKYGWKWGAIAGILHYCMVTTVSGLHGGFCLYNGGLTAAMACILLVPVLERFASEREPLI